jgi:hypothetical protein
MITIKRDENLAKLAEIIGAEPQVIAQSIISTIDPFALDDFLAGMTLGQFMDEIGYYVDDFIDKLHIQASIPLSVLDSSITGLLREVKFYYDGADHPCKNCGYEIMWVDDDMAAHKILQGSCPICHQTAVREL